MPSAFVKIMLCWALGCIFGLVYALGDIEESMSQATLMNCLIFFPEKNSKNHSESFYRHNDVNRLLCKYSERLNFYELIKADQN